MMPARTWWLAQAGLSPPARCGAPRAPQKWPSDTDDGLTTRRVGSNRRLGDSPVEEATNSHSTSHASAARAFSVASAARNRSLYCNDLLRFTRK